MIAYLLPEGLYVMSDGASTAKRFYYNNSNPGGCVALNNIKKKGHIRDAPLDFQEGQEVFRKKSRLP